eukprot:485353_1
MSSKVTITVKGCIPKPSQHPTNNKCIIISTYFGEDKTTPAIYTYNMETNESEIIYKYNNTFNFKPECHGQFIDASNNTLILYGGVNETFKTFDLNTNQIKQINDKNIISKCY